MGYSQCHGTENPSDYFNDCVFDYCANKHTASDSFIAYMLACTDAGVRMPKEAWEATANAVSTLPLLAPTPPVYPRASAISPSAVAAPPTIMMGTSAEDDSSSSVYIPIITVLGVLICVLLFAVVHREQHWRQCDAHNQTKDPEAGCGANPLDVRKAEILDVRKGQQGDAIEKEGEQCEADNVAPASQTSWVPSIWSASRPSRCPGSAKGAMTECRDIGGDMSQATNTPVDAKDTRATQGEVDQKGITVQVERVIHQADPSESLEMSEKTCQVSPQGPDEAKQTPTKMSGLGRHPSQIRKAFSGNAYSQIHNESLHENGSGGVIAD